MDTIVKELITTKVKKYNIKKMLKKYEKIVEDQIEAGDINAEPTNNLHIMYSKALKYYYQNQILRKENQELKQELEKYKSEEYQLVSYYQSKK
tara:strand:- start:8371 stop:8649 length:279 start_codon:yes stop_codon:yes gene_type:complete